MHFRNVPWWAEEEANWYVRKHPSRRGFYSLFATGQESTSLHTAVWRWYITSRVVLSYHHFWQGDYPKTMINLQTKDGAYSVICGVMRRVWSDGAKPKIFLPIPHGLQHGLNIGQVELNSRSYRGPPTPPSNSRGPPTHSSLHHITV